MLSDVGRRIDGNDDVNEPDNTARGGKYYSLKTLRNSMPSEGTPSGGY